MRRVVLNALLISLVACGNTTSARTSSAPRAQEPVAGPCEGCEAVFNGMPATLSSRARIAPVTEWGEALTITGKVYGPDGAPRGGVVVYAYHTNAGGVYPPSDGSHRHGLLRGWVVSDADGAYAFDTIRPGSYPGRTDPAHIHMHVIERGCATYYIDDIVFTDDPRLTVEHERQMSRGRGGKGVATPTRANGRWSVVRDIHLGMNIPDHPRCAER